MGNKNKKNGPAVFACIAAALLIGALAAGSGKITNLSPFYVFAVTVTVFLLVAAACIRIFAIPKFRYVPGKLQMLLEQIVGTFDRLGNSRNRPKRKNFFVAVKDAIVNNRHVRMGLAVSGCAAAVMLVGAMAVGAPPDKKHESLQEAMRDAVLHESAKISFLGLKDVNPSFISAVTVTVFLLAVAACIRVFVIPKFRYIPGKFQMLLEQLVALFDGLAKSNSPHRHGFLGAYVFAAGIYIFTGTISELFGLQGITTHGASIALPAPLADINAAIALGFLSYGVILSGGIAGNGIRGVGYTLKDFSLPISMSFRLFGALLSGLLVTELVYYNIRLSFVLPVLVGVLFTLLHALIQSYVLTMLTSLFYGEVTEPHEKKPKKTRQKKLKFAFKK